EQGPRAFRNNELSVAHPCARKTGAHMSLCLVRRQRIAAITGRARQTQSVFAIRELVERLRRTELMHRFDLRVTFQTAFERRGGPLLVGCRSIEDIYHQDTKAQRSHKPKKKMTHGFAHLCVFVSCW